MHRARGAPAGGQIMRHLLMGHGMRGGMMAHGFMGFLVFHMLRRLAMRLLLLGLVVAVVVFWLRSRQPRAPRG
jgi:hypothetical protein